MTDNELRKALKHRLKPRKSKKYVKWRVARKQKGNDLHHLLGSFTGMKLNDFLLAEVNHERHITAIEDEDFIEMLINSIEGILDYVEYIETGGAKRAKVGRKRTLPENRYYFGVIVRMISEETGYSGEEVHNLLLCNAFGFEEKKIGNAIIRTPLKRSSDLSTTEFEYLCRTARQLGAVELGIFIPKPGETEILDEIADR